MKSARHSSPGKLEGDHGKISSGEISQACMFEMNQAVNINSFEGGNKSANTSKNNEFLTCRELDNKTSGSKVNSMQISKRTNLVPSDFT